jgi:3',5'-cyclic AMP phosphodiesterase CpdA
MASYTLAHLSDPHLPPLPAPRLSELAGKRALGYLNWTRNRHRYHRRDVLDTLVSDLQAQVPDHIALTGDLVNLALEAEFAPSLAWLQSVGPPDRVTAIPGNHDAYVRATRYRFKESWNSYLRGDEAAQVTFPFVRQRGPLALIGLSTALPTPLLMATGTLGQTQIEGLERVLSGLAGDDAFRVLLVHHPLRSRSIWCCMGTITSIRRSGSRGRIAKSPSSACPRPRRARTATCRRPPTISFPSRAMATRGVVIRWCEGSTTSCKCGKSGGSD